MNIRKEIFTLSESEIELDLKWSFYHEPARLYGLPENCRPEYTESEICLPGNLYELLQAHAQKMVAQWKQEIEGTISGMEFDDAPAKWAADLADCKEDEASEKWERKMMDKLGEL